jgi:hypothetical protein
MELTLEVRSQVTDRLLGKHVKAARVGEGGDLGHVGRGDRLVLRSHHKALCQAAVGPRPPEARPGRRGIAKVPT